jgi:hypothetical protein
MVTACAIASAKAALIYSVIARPAGRGDPEFVDPTDILDCFRALRSRSQ